MVTRHLNPVEARKADLTPPEEGSNAGYWQNEQSRQFVRNPYKVDNSERFATAIFAAPARALGGIWGMIARSAQAHGVPVPVAVAIVKQESGGRCNARNGHAVGIMQLMPQTARNLGVRDRADCAQNLEGGMKMLASIGEAHGWSCASLSLYQRGEAARPACDAYGRQVWARMARM